MNKKLMSGAALGAIAMGAAALAFTTAGGGDRHGLAPTRLEPAADTSRWHDPVVFVGETFVATEPTTSTGESTGSALPSLPQAPATGESKEPGTPAPADTGHDSEPGGHIPQAGGPDAPATGGEGGPGLPIDIPGQPDPSPKPPVIFNPQVNDAICDALDCDNPQLPFDPDLADDICDALECVGNSGGQAQPKIDPCDLVGCPKPALPLQPGKIIDVLRRL